MLGELYSQSRVLQCRHVSEEQKAWHLIEKEVKDACACNLARFADHA